MPKRNNGPNRDIEVMTSVTRFSSYKHIDRFITKMAKALGINRSQYMRNCFESIMHFRCTLVEVYFGEQNKYFYTVIPSHLVNIEKFKLSLSSMDLPIAQDITMFGLGEFEFKLVGLFPSLERVTEYRDFLMNRKLDKGAYLYNAEIITGVSPRYITIILDANNSNFIFNYCVSKSMLITDLVNRLLKIFIKSQSK